MKKNIEKYKYDAFIILIMLYFCTTFFYKLLPIASSIIGVPIILIVLSFYIKNFKKKDLIVFAACVFYIVVSLINHDSQSIIVSHTIHLVSTLLLLWKMTDKEILKNLNKKLPYYYKPLIILLDIIAVINIILYLSGHYNELNTGNVVYRGLSQGSHTIASVSCMSIMMLINLYKNDWLSKISFPTYFVYLFIIFASGSRVYLVVLLPIAYFTFLKFKKQLLRVNESNKIRAICFIAIALVSGMFTSSNIKERFVSTTNNKYISKNKVEAMSSGRLVWWKDDLSKYIEGSPANLLFGRGNKYVFEVNKEDYGLYIWAHNDFIQILIAYGLVGLSAYLYIMFSIFRKLYDKKKIFSIIAIIFAYLATANINGFYHQQHLVFMLLFMIIFTSGVKKK